jgi:hypothetical protein
MAPSYHGLWQASALFVGLLTVFHVYVFISKPDARFLKKVDYYWLGFAALSLVSAATSQRQILAQGELDLSRRMVVSTVRDLKYAGKLAQQYTCDTPWIYPIIPVPEAIQRYNTREAACAWFTELKNQLDRTELDLGSAIKILDQPLPTTVPSSWNYSPLNDVVRAAKGTLAENRQLEADAQTSDAEKILIVILPYLLAVALALRITKVTGELRQ